MMNKGNLKTVSWNIVISEAYKKYGFLKMQNLNTLHF